MAGALAGARLDRDVELLGGQIAYHVGDQGYPALPLGGTVGMSILLPFIFGMDPHTAVALLIGLIAVNHTGDTYPSILMGVPGTAGSQATIMDGYPLARQGQAARALGAAFFVSMVGGVIGSVVLLGTITVARPIVLSLGSPELFMLTIFGLSMVGILSRGILLPKIVVSMGVHRTDAGWLGHGIYFGDAVCTSLGYTTPGKKKTRLVAIARVALGKMKDYTKITYGLAAPPEGYHSCHGVRAKMLRPSQFADDEYVVYDSRQQRVEYVVEIAA